MDTWVCADCGATKALEGFRRQKGAPSGHRQPCLPCHAVREADRRDRRARGVKPGALVLVMPPRPVPPPEPLEPDPPRPARALGHFETQAAKFIAALEPPAGPADGVLVASLERYAELADRASSVGCLDPVREAHTCIQGMIRVQRELAATRIVKLQRGGPTADEAGDKLDQFLDAL